MVCHPPLGIKILRGVFSGPDAKEAADRTQADSIPGRDAKNADNYKHWPGNFIPKLDNEDIQPQEGQREQWDFSHDPGKDPEPEPCNPAAAMTISCD
jgi:hypothetical protein